MSNSWQPHVLNARLPCPSLFPGVCSNPYPLMPSNYLILCCPLLFLLSIFPSIKVSSNEPSLCIRWPKYYSFSFSISPSNEYSGLISFRIDWYDLFAVQGSLKSLLQHHHSKAWILWHSAFFMVKLSHLYMTTGKTIALTTRTFVGKVSPQLVLSMYSPDVPQILPLFSNFTLLIFFYLNNYRSLPIGLPTFTLTPLHFILHKVTTRNYEDYKPDHVTQDFKLFKGSTLFRIKSTLFTWPKPQYDCDHCSTVISFWASPWTLYSRHTGPGPLHQLLPLPKMFFLLIFSQPDPSHNFTPQCICHLLRITHCNTSSCSNFSSGTYH